MFFVLRSLFRVGKEQKISSKTFEPKTFITQLVFYYFFILYLKSIRLKVYFGGQKIKYASTHVTILNVRGKIIEDVSGFTR